jgi:hypothetical protein
LKHWISLDFGPYLQERIEEGVQGFLGAKIDGTEARVCQFAEECAWLLFEVGMSLGAAREAAEFEATAELVDLDGG